MIIAIDGPAGTGKSTIAKNAGRKIRYYFFEQRRFLQNFDNGRA